MSRPTRRSRRGRPDPVVTHSQREALVILVAFVMFMVWSISACYMTGYHEPGGQSPDRVFGMPSWVFWGVLVPWLAADVFSLWFCLFFMADDPLQEADEEAASGPVEPEPDKEDGHA